MEKEKIENRLGTYKTPIIEITEIAIEQSILNNGSATSSLDNIPGEYW